MINLLPIKEKQNIKKEYTARIASVFFVMLSAVLVSVFVLLLVALFCFDLEEKDLTKFKNINYAEEKDSVDLLGAVDDINRKLLLLQSDENKIYLHNDVFKTIIARRGTVEISALTYELGKDGKSKVRVQGISPTREKLFSFIKALEGEGFKEVNSPVSNYVKDKDIPFLLEIIL